MALSASLKKVSAKLIIKFGNDLTLKQITQGDYNPATGQYEDTVVTVTTKGVDSDYVSEHSASGDMVITFVSDIEIDAFDRADYRGKERDIKSIRQIAMQNGIIVYQAIVTGDARVMA